MGKIRACALLLAATTLLFSGSGTPADSGRGETSLWSGDGGPHLRGANIYQARVYSVLDGPEFKGKGPVGPPFTQDDFNRLSALGANYVHISHPGIFTEDPPFKLDESIRDHLDHLLDMILQADMFAVIGFRTGPGRSEFTFFWGEHGEWFDESYYNDQVWRSADAQAGWVNMWRAAAAHYRHHAAVIGYDLMVEPNSNEVWLDIWDPEEFYRDYAGTLYDWNRLFPQIAAGVRGEDPDTPLLIGGLGYSALDWLPYLASSQQPGTIYTFHPYQPILYTHQEPHAPRDYPGVYDIDWDGVADSFDRSWLDDRLSVADDFAAARGAPLSVTEFGVMRWAPGAADYMRDLIGLFEARGLNHALWVWDPSWTPWTEEVNAFNFRHGPDPGSRADVPGNALQGVIRESWKRNILRPSNWDPSPRKKGIHRR